MSCYFRHLKDILAEAGIEVTPANKKQIDQVVHRIVGVEYKDCPVAWRAVKQIMSDEKTRQEFVKNLKTALG
jgi:molecular chaperone GrpE (heat shock protein)